LKQQFVRGIAWRVGWGGLDMRGSAKLLRIDVCLASGQKNRSARRDEPRNLFRRTL
jgi:hypothetical protein